MIALVVVAAGIGMPVSAEETHMTHGTEVPAVQEKSKPITETPQQNRLKFLT